MKSVYTWWYVAFSAIYCLIYRSSLCCYVGCLHGLTGSMVNHRSIAPGFKPWPDYVRRVFYLWLCLIIFGGHSAHLAYFVHKSGRKTVTFYLLLLLVLCTHLVSKLFIKSISNSIIKFDVEEPGLNLNSVFHLCQYKHSCWNSGIRRLLKLILQ